VFKRSARYLTLALTLVALTATVRTAHAQTDPPCTDPNANCVVGGTDPQPTGSVVTGGTISSQASDGSDGTDNSQSMDDLISYLLMLYGLA
jgi:hypothetical protein